MKWSVIAIVLMLSVSISFAQGAQGTIMGTVTDPNGNVVSDTRIQVKRVSTGTVYKTETSRDGTFKVTGLSAGTYELLVPTIGFTFRPYEKKDLLVQSGQTLRADARLEYSGNLGTVGDDTFLTIRNRYAGLKGPAPHMPDGKPDFSGTWNGSEDPNAEQAATLPWASALQKERVQNHFKDSPSGFCLPGEVFPSSPLVYKFVQTPKLLLQLVEDEPNFRQVFLNGTHPKDPDPTWKGHSIGKWEGNTLVVDTVGFNDKGWLTDGFPHTEKLHVVERYRRPDLAHLVIDVMIEDPGTVTKPRTLHMTWELAPGEELIEYICSENNRYRSLPAGK
jgi:hypothetical protein